MLGIPRKAVHGDCTTGRASVFKPCQKAVYLCSGLLRRRRLVMQHLAPQRSADDLMAAAWLRTRPTAMRMMPDVPPGNSADCQR